MRTVQTRFIGNPQEVEVMVDLLRGLEIPIISVSKPLPSRKNPKNVLVRVLVNTDECGRWGQSQPVYPRDY